MTAVGQGSPQPGQVGTPEAGTVRRADPDTDSNPARHGRTTLLFLASVALVGLTLARTPDSLSVAVGSTFFPIAVGAAIGLPASGRWAVTGSSAVVLVATVPLPAGFVVAGTLVLTVLVTLWARHRVGGRDGPVRDERVVAAMSHALRTPLTGLVGFAHLTGVDREVEAGIRRMSSATDDVIVALRRDRGLPLVSIGRVARSVAVAAAWRETAVGEVVTPGLPPVSGATMTDATAIAGVVRRMVETSIEYGRPDPRVGVDVVGDRWLEVTVEVGGSGIPAAVLDRAFDRAEPPIEDDPGAPGLSLVVARLLTQHLGGDLLHECREGSQSIVMRIPFGVVDD